MIAWLAVSALVLSVVAQREAATTEAAECAEVDACRAALDVANNSPSRFRSRTMRLSPRFSRCRPCLRSTTRADLTFCRTT